MQHAQKMKDGGDWQNARVSPCGTHHTRGGSALYKARFDGVLPFHAPGLAPVHDGGKAWHIKADGTAAYPGVFLETFGFYEGLAAVRDNSGWFHIAPDGATAYKTRKEWCGNFQGGRCVVCDGGKYYHILPDGRPLYPERYAYVGDFREMCAVVKYEDGMCGHITESGNSAHSRRYFDLDVYHKGYARARDCGGWMHIDKKGNPIYSGRYLSLEPFYNGRALAQTLDGEKVVINAAGEKITVIGNARSADNAGDLFHELSADMTGYWSTFAIAAAVKLRLPEQLPLAKAEIRESFGDCANRTELLLMALSALNIVVCSDGIWQLTPKGQILQKSHPYSLADAASVWGKFAGAGAESWTGVIAGAEPKDFFAAISKNAEEVRETHGMLTAYARRDYESLADVLPLNNIKHLVDAGGGTGVVAEMLARKHSGLAVTILDRPEVLRLRGILGKTNKRIKALPGDIFSDWEVKADAVLLARVLHDWNDEKAMLILRNANRALPSGGKLFIIEAAGDAREAGALLSLHILSVSGGRERTSREYKTLLEQAGFAPANFCRINSSSAVIIGEKVK